MTTTIQQMDVVIEQLRAAGIKTFTMVGGAVVTQEYADRIGADLYARDALEAVAKIKKLLGTVPERGLSLLRARARHSPCRRPRFCANNRMLLANCCRQRLRETRSSQADQKCPGARHPPTEK